MTHVCNECLMSASICTYTETERMGRDLSSVKGKAQEGFGPTRVSSLKWIGIGRTTNLGRQQDAHHQHVEHDTGLDDELDLEPMAGHHVT